MQNSMSRDATNSHGNALKDLMDRFDMCQLCSKPTHLNNAGEPISLLDLAFTNVPSLFNSAKVSQPISSSDHLPVILNTSLAGQFNPPVIRNYKNGSTAIRITIEWLKLSCSTTGHMSSNQIKTSMISGADGKNNFPSKSNPLYLKLQSQKIPQEKNDGHHDLRNPFANWFAPKTDYLSMPVPLDYPNTGNYTALPEIKLLMQSKWQRHNTFTG